MELVLLEQAKKDIEYWKKSGNQKVQKRISELIDDTHCNILLKEKENQKH